MQEAMLTRHSALFLDIDGTLLEFAPSPEMVEVPAMLAPLLAQLSGCLGGALALVSGRPLSQIDALFAPMRFTCAGEHGAVLRLPGGEIDCADAADAMPRQWLDSLIAAQKDWPGTLLEPKTYGVVVHYRQAPEREADIFRLMEELVRRDAAFELLPAVMALEIRNRKVTKAGPVLRLMSMPPFHGRTPVFVGDDVTDHDGFRAARSLGGIAADVHEMFGGKPAAVRNWLEAMASTMGKSS